LAGLIGFIQRFLKFFSVAVLLIVPCYFGYMGQSTEMGLAILAGALGLAFSNIDKLSEFSGAGFSAKMKDQIQAVVEKETETTLLSNGESETVHASPIEASVLKALSNPKYTWRTLLGISKDASCSESEAWTVLVNLVGNKFVQVANKNKTGEMIWALTTKGRQLAARNA
jgi:hypothetical protein